MGCPNLPVDFKNPEGEKGVIFVAVKGEGAFQVRADRQAPLRCEPTPTFAFAALAHVPDALANLDGGHL